MRRMDVPRIFVDEASTKILLAAHQRPRNGLEISRATGVPVAETFARLKLLTKKGLIRVVERELTARGTVILVYESTFNDAYVFVEQGRVKVRFSLTSYGMSDKWGEIAVSL